MRRSSERSLALAAVVVGCGDRASAAVDRRASQSSRSATSTTADLHHLRPRPTPTASSSSSGQGTVVEVVDGLSYALRRPRPRWSPAATASAGCSRSRWRPTSKRSGRFYAAYTGTTAAGGAEGDVHVDSFGRTAGGGARDPRADPHLGRTRASQPQRRPAPVRPRRLPLHLARRRRRRRRSRSKTARTPSVLLGKILRIDPAPGAEAPAYSIPAGNPFAGDRRAAPRSGPTGCAIPGASPSTALTGDMVIGDVGQGAHEEIDFATSPAAGPVGGAGRQLRLELPRGLHRLRRVTGPASCAGGRAASPNRSSTTRTPIPAAAAPTAARSPAATSSATRASATSTAATSTPTSARAGSARWSCRAMAPASRRDDRSEGLDPSARPTRSPSAKTPAAGSTSSPATDRSTASSARRRPVCAGSAAAGAGRQRPPRRLDGIEARPPPARRPCG